MQPASKRYQQQLRIIKRKKEKGNPLTHEQWCLWYDLEIEDLKRLFSA